MIKSCRHAGHKTIAHFTAVSAHPCPGTKLHPFSEPNKSAKTPSVDI